MMNKIFGPELEDLDVYDFYFITEKKTDFKAKAFIQWLFGFRILELKVNRAVVFGLYI